MTASLFVETAPTSCAAATNAVIRSTIPAVALSAALHLVYAINLIAVLLVRSGVEAVSPSPPFAAHPASITLPRTTPGAALTTAV